MPVLMALGVAEALTSGPAAAQHLREVHDALDDPRARAELANVLCRAMLFTGDPVQAEAVATQDAAALGPEDADLARGLEAFGLISYYFGAGGERPLERLEALRHPPGPGVGARALAGVAAYDWANRGGHADECVELARQAIAGGVLAGMDSTLLSIPPTLVLVLADGADALDELHKLDEIGHRRGSLLDVSSLQLWVGYARWRRGELEAAEDLLRQAYEALNAYGIGLGPRAYSDSFLAEVLIDRGDLAGARAAHNTNRDQGDWSDGARYWQHARMRLLLAEQQWDEALDAADAFADRFAMHADSPGTPWRVVRADALERLDRIDEARVTAEEELAAARVWGAPGTVGRALTQLGRLEREDGIPRLEEAVALLDGSPARLALARALAALGSAQRHARRPAEAREPLRRALELATACGAPPLAEQARSELYAAGARPRTEALAGVEALTASEKRVADLAATGDTNRDIAQALYVTPEDRRGPPLQRLPQARHPLAARARRRARGRVSGAAGPRARARRARRDGRRGGRGAGAARAHARAPPGSASPACSPRCARAAAPRLRVLAARSSELEREFAFGVVRQLFEARGRRGAGARARRRRRLGRAALRRRPGGGRRGRERRVVRRAARPLLAHAQPRGRAPAAARRRRPALVRPAVAALPRLPRAAAGRRAGARRRHAAQRRAGHGSRRCWPRSSHDPAVAPLRPGPLGAGGGRGARARPSSARAPTRRSARRATTRPAATRCCCASSCARWRPRAWRPARRNVDGRPRGRAARRREHRAAAARAAARRRRRRHARGRRAGRERRPARDRRARRASARPRSRRPRARSCAPRSCGPSRRSASSTRSSATPSTTSSRRPSARSSTSARPTCCASTGAPAEQVAAQLLMAPRRGEAWVAELLQAAGEAAMRDLGQRVRRRLPRAARSRSRRRPERHDAVLLALGQAEALTNGPAAVEHLQEVYGAPARPGRARADRGRARPHAALHRPRARGGRAAARRARGAAARAARTCAGSCTRSS